MGFLSGRWEETDRRAREVLAPHLAGEALVGAAMANEQKTFSANLYVVGVTPTRLVLVPVDRRWQPKGTVRSLTRPEITATSVWGWGDGAKTWLAPGSDQQIRIATADWSVKLMVLGGNVAEDALAGEGHLQGLEALVAFLQSARR